METETCKSVFGVDSAEIYPLFSTRVMAEELGFVSDSCSKDLSTCLTRSQYVDIGPGPEKHTWGAVLLSKVSN